jgi:hypothetical protein
LHKAQLKGFKGMIATAKGVTDTPTENMSLSSGVRESLRDIPEEYQEKVKRMLKKVKKEERGEGFLAKAKNNVNEHRKEWDED